jgi:hypothetical protein
MNDVLTLLFPPAFLQALAGLLALILLDVVFGVSVAIKAGKFEWSALANFYRTSVVPNLLGWAVADIVLRMAVHYGLPVVAQLEPLAAGALYVTMLAALLAQIGSKLLVLRGEQPV